MSCGFKLAFDFSLPSYTIALPYFDSLSLLMRGAIFFGSSGDFICVYILSFPFWNTGLAIFAVVFIRSCITLGLRMADLLFVVEPKRWFCLGSLLSRFWYNLFLRLLELSIF